VISYPEWEGTQKEQRVEPFYGWLIWEFNPQPGHFQQPAPTKPTSDLGMSIGQSSMVSTPPWNNT
ncbi:hypothetical protein HGM15179_005829, partial [Zosterops borbonicus]